MKELRGVNGWGLGLGPEERPLAHCCHCAPMSRFRTASTGAQILVWMLERVFKCLQKELSVDCLRALSRKTYVAQNRIVNSPLSIAEGLQSYLTCLAHQGRQKRDPGCCAVQMWLPVPALACPFCSPSRPCGFPTRVVLRVPRAPVWWTGKRHLQVVSVTREDRHLHLPVRNHPSLLCKPVPFLPTLWGFMSLFF